MFGAKLKNVEAHVDHDLGFGSVVARESRTRLLNRDGSFNVRRVGLSYVESLSPYHSLLTMSWWRFFLVVLVTYLGINTVFALAYLSCGPEALAGPSHFSAFYRAFFFSIQTFATIGYGQLVPQSLTANYLVAAEALVGLMGFALATGILFARFSRPTAKIIFSTKALIAPYRGILSFQFRIANARRNQLVEVQAKVIFSRFEGEGSERKRNFYQLSLERERVAFFPLAWTVVHPIDEGSPLVGIDREQLLNSRAEFLVLLSAFDETFSQNVHSRCSYTAEELVCMGRFESLFIDGQASTQLGIDISRLSIFEQL